MGESRRLEFVGVGVLTLLVLILRWSQIHQSIVGDEIFTYKDVVGRSFGAVLRTVHTGGENSPPLYFLLAWLTAKLGDPTVWIRLPSIILGAAVIPVIYAIGRETAGRTAGFVAALAVGLSPFSFYYGVEARPYATMMFFVALSTLALLRAVKTNHKGWWALYIVSAAAAAYSHYTSIFVLAVQALWSLWYCRDRLRTALIANGLIVLIYLPWLPHLRGKELAVIGALEPLTTKNVFIDLTRLVVGYPYAGVHAIPTYFGLAVVAVCLLAGLVFAAWRWRASEAVRPPADVILLVLQAVATPIGLLLYSLSVTDLWLARGLYASTPALAVLGAALLVAIPRPYSAVAVVAVLVTLVSGTIQASSEAYARPPYRSVAQYLDRTAAPNDPIALASLTGAPSIPTQFHKPHRVVGLNAIWRLVPAHGEAFVMLDDDLARVLHITSAAPPGFQLTRERHYGGLFPFKLLTYRRSGSSG